jgi:SAM-dependent methyltransferase
MCEARRAGFLPLLPLALCLVASWAAGGAVDPAEAKEATAILDAAGASGGLVIHLHCGDGALTAALHADGRYVVQGLDADPDAVAKARAAIQTLGLYGPVSVAQFDGKRLPYVENLANVVVADDLGGVARAEAMRVLAPGGALVVKQGGRWVKAVKPRQAGTDEWTHFLHGPNGNAVAHDTVVGPPRRVRWIAGPRRHLPHPTGT